MNPKNDNYQLDSELSSFPILACETKASYICGGLALQVENPKM